MEFTVYVLLKPGLENFEQYFSIVWGECNCAAIWALFGIAFLWDWSKNWPFPVLWPLLSFPNLLAYEGGTFTASSFRIWNNSMGIPLPRLALFVVILPKPHLTSHSRMSGSRWVITSSWLSGSWSFLYSYVYSCLLFLISSASVRSIPFLSFCAHLCMKCSLGISNFLEEISSLSRSIVFLYFFALVTEEGFLISSHYSEFLNSTFRWVYLSFSPLPFASFLFSALCKGFLGQPFCLSAFLFLGDGLDNCLLYDVMNLCP